MGLEAQEDTDRFRRPHEDRLQTGEKHQLGRFRYKDGRGPCGRSADRHYSGEEDEGSEEDEGGESRQVEGEKGEGGERKIESCGKSFWRINLCGCYIENSDILLQLLGSLVAIVGEIKDFNPK